MSQIRRVTIRLHKRHDLDLITFMDTHQMDFKKAVYCALTAFAKGEVFIIKIPPRLEQPLHAKNTYMFTLRLNRNTDAAVIQMIEDIENGYKNCFIKNLLRLYLCTPISVEFLKDKTKIDSYEQRFRIFKRGKRIADAARVKNLKVGKNANNNFDRMKDIFSASYEKKETPAKKENDFSHVKVKQEISEKPEPGSDFLQHQNTTENKTIADPIIPKAKTNESENVPKSPEINSMDASENDDMDFLTDLFDSIISGKE